MKLEINLAPRLMGILALLLEILAFEVLTEFILSLLYITLTLRAVDRVTTLSYWSITSPVSMDTKPSSSGHQAMNLQPSSTVLASMSLDLRIPQYDGANDPETQDCELCEAQFSGKNRFANKRTHLINHHLRRKFIRQSLLL